MRVPLIFDIAENSYVDGPGIRTTVFLKGCNLRCAWCHNPESQKPQAEWMIYRDKCVGCGTCRVKCPQGGDLEKCSYCGTCEDYCPADARHIAGRRMTLDEIMERVLADKPFYGKDGGVTVSGGECLLYPEFVSELLSRCKSEGIGTAVDTAGAVPFEAFETVMPTVDLFLYDIKAKTPALHKELTGVDNSLILENYEKLLSLGARVIVRVPVVPGANAGEEELGAIRDYLAAHKPEAVELLPYHRLGENKYRAIGREPTAFAVPDAAFMQRWKDAFILSQRGQI